MKRRDFIFGLGGAALCSNAARGQQNSPIAQHSTTKKRIAQVVPSTKVEDMQADPNTRPFFDELKRLGYVEGENLIVERYSGEGRLERYESLAHEVVDTKPDLILTAGTPLTLRFKAATSTIPIVTITGDPIRFGIVSSIARPGGNITGVSVDAGVEIWSKRLEMLAEAVPKLVNVVFVSTQGGWNGAGGRATREIAPCGPFTLPSRRGMPPRRPGRCAAMTIAGSTPSGRLPRTKPLKQRLGRTTAFNRSTNPRDAFTISF